MTSTDSMYQWTTIEGMDSYGQPETVRISVADNADWNLDTADSEYRYIVTRDVAGDVTDEDGYDELAEALARMAAMADETREEHAVNLETVRDDWATDLEGVVTEDWLLDEAGAVEALAGLIRSGKAAEALAALKAAGLA